MATERKERYPPSPLLPSIFNLASLSSLLRGEGLYNLLKGKLSLCMTMEQYAILVLPQELQSLGGAIQ